LPASWEGLSFRLQVRGQLLEVAVTHAATTYRLLEGRGLLVEHCGAELRLMPGAEIVVPTREPSGDSQLRAA
jgi:alpha,alpha-trehalose phosphorylase